VFEDPFHVSCAACGKETKYQVNALLAHKAKCLYCDSTLDDTSVAMNEVVSVATTQDYFWRISLTLEDKLGIQVLDDNLEIIGNKFDSFNDLKTVSDLISLFGINDNYISQIFVHTFSDIGFTLSLPKELNRPLSEIFGKVIILLHK